MLPQSNINWIVSIPADVSLIDVWDAIDLSLNSKPNMGLNW